MKSVILLAVLLAIYSENSLVMGLTCHSCAGLTNCSVKTCDNQADVCYSCFIYSPVSVFVSGCVSAAECRRMQTMPGRAVKCCETDLCNS
ncbi:weak neurotoxin 8-like [Lampris incognitus]|uniref:weak neurotoxin 8-like n=1 Tax=Lampris incognitus TaxID=2546036 RepID=UPI0024B49102|nr:weak neurotoxin 8-like [Lampris incognitus]